MGTREARAAWPCTQSLAGHSGTRDAGAAQGLTADQREKTLLAYQGQRVPVDLVAYVGGDMTVNPRLEINADEGLYRDEVGRYYLRREANTLDYGGPQERQASGREQVHRLSTTAALLWATMRVNAVGWELRQDALTLMEAASATPASKSFVLDAQADAMLGQFLARTVTTEQDTLPLGADPRDIVNAAVVFYLDESDMGVSTSERLEEARARRLDGETPDQEPPVGYVDATRYGVSSRTLEAAARYAAEHGRNVNEMLAELLDCVAPDGQRLLDKDQEEKVPVSNRTPAPPEVSTTAEGAFRLSFDIPATERHCAGHRVVEVPADQVPEVDRLAAIFGLSRAAFVEASSRGRLPGQPLRDCPGYTPMDELFRAQHLRFSLLDDGLTPRIQRAAQVRELSLEDFIAEAIASAVDCYEQNIIVHPHTGELLCSDDSVLIESISEEMTASPIGREDESSFRLQMGRQQVQLSVWLTPKQIDYIEFPHEVHDMATGTEVPCALIPLDPEGNVLLRVGRREIKPGEPIIKAVVRGHNLPEMLLDHKAAGLVRRYLAAAPGYSASDVVNGAIYYAMEAAFIDLENTSNREKVLQNQVESGDEFTDDGWGYVEEEVCAAWRLRKAGLPGSECEHAAGDIKARFLSGELPVPSIDAAPAALHS